MSIDPLALGIPEGFRHWVGDPAEDRIGPFFFRRGGDGRVQTALRVQPHHCNAYGIVHGGVLMTFVDYTLCIAAMADDQDRVVTVSANCDFTASARAGELLLGEGEVVRAGRRLVFTRALLRSGDQVVMGASGVVKRVGG